MIFHFEFLNIHITVSPGLFNTMPVPLATLKLAGVIVTAFEPPVDTLMIILIWPFAPSANVHGACAEVASTSVTALVTSIAVDVEPSPVIDYEVEFKPNQDGMLLKTSSAAIFLLIGVPLGSSTTWNKSTAARPSPRSVNCVTFLSAIFISY